MRINIKNLFLFFYIFIESIFSLNNIVISGNDNTLNKQNNFYKLIYSEKFPLNKNDEFRSLLEKKLFNSKNKIVNLIVEKQENEKGRFSVQITSDTQYELDNKYYAEGNVVILLENGELRAEKLIYDEFEENLTLEGNILYSKGNQYFEASYLSFSFKDDKGYLNNVYGVIDLLTFSEDLGYKFEDDIEVNEKNYQANDISSIKYKDSGNIGLENTFEDGRKFNITDLNFEVPQIKKWRFKADKISIENEQLLSERIFFTNDPYNKPQFLLESKKFSVKTNEDKIKIISNKTWINLDDKLSFPIGRRSIIDRDPISRWSIGNDNEDKDGFYLSRAFNTKKIFGKYDLQITPYLLIQRVLENNTNSFVKKDSSILSDKVIQDISFSDYFAISSSLKGQINKWDLNIDADINSLDFDKFSDSFRSLVTLKKSFDLVSKNVNKENENKNISNLLDLQLYGAYRKKVLRSFTDDQEIYLGKGFTISNKKTWDSKNLKNYFSLNYDIGEFEAKEKNVNELKILSRNVFTANYSNEILLWQKQNIDEQIDSSYKYSPEVIRPRLTWESSVNSGIYFYGNGSQQNAISFSSGPRIILGSYKRKFFDYTDFNLQGNFIIKNGESPFAFDDVEETEKLKLNLEQQIIGPLLFSYEGFVVLDNKLDDYGKLSNNKFGLNIKRRAYSVGAFYKESNQAFGIQFNINNFNYLGNGSRF